MKGEEGRLAEPSGEGGQEGGRVRGQVAGEAAGAGTTGVGGEGAGCQLNFVICAKCCGRDVWEGGVGGARGGGGWCRRCGRCGGWAWCDTECTVDRAGYTESV